MREEFKRELLEEVYNVGYRYLTTDDDGDDCVFKTEPKRVTDYWNDEASSGNYLPFSLGFSSWVDEEPKIIAELLGIYEVDWSQIPVDTKILVSDDVNKWHKRYFAKYEGNMVYAWNNGLTSWNAKGSNCWEYAKLAEE